MSQRQRETAASLLDSSIRFARAVLTECQDNRMLFPANAWLFAILAKVISSARSARMLILARQYWDAKLVVRSMYDSLIDVLYILNDPGKTEQLAKLLRIEMAVDEFERLTYAAKRLGKRVDQLPQETFVVAVEREFAWAKRQPAFNARGREWPRRWRYIGAKVKLAEIRGGQRATWVDLLDFSVKHMGDAAAHARGLALQTFVAKTNRGELRFTTKPKLHFDLGKRTLLVMEPFVCVLGVSVAIIEGFTLGEPLESRARRLHTRWKRMVKRGATQSSSEN